MVRLRLDRGVWAGRELAASSRSEDPELLLAEESYEDRYVDRLESYGDSMKLVCVGAGETWIAPSARRLLGVNCTMSEPNTAEVGEEVWSWDSSESSSITNTPLGARLPR